MLLGSLKFFDEGLLLLLFPFLYFLSQYAGHILGSATQSAKHKGCKK